MTKLWLAVVALFLSCSLQVFAEANVKKIEVNGFTVYLVDTQKGNQFGYTFAVPYGSADDEPKMFGRAHFFEHAYSRGSTKYPGHDTLIQAMTKFGYKRNAATGYSYTMYFGAGLEEHGLEAMTMHLAPLWGVEVEPSSIEREKATVINEIEGSAPNRPGRAIYYYAMMFLPEVGHSARGSINGDSSTLVPMTPEDLRELHGRIYHAGNVKLAVIGNFSSGKWKAENIIETLSKALPPVEHKKAPYIPNARTPMFAKSKVIDVELKSDRSGMIFVPIDPGADIRDVRNFASIYNAKARNSILEVAQRELGWLSSLNFDESRIGDQRFMAIHFGMTEAGYAKREEVSQWLLNAVKAAGEANVSDLLLKQKGDQNLENARRLEESVDSLMNSYASWLGQEGFDDKLMLDWKGVNARLTNESIRRGAKAVRFENMAFTFIGPASLKNAQYDPMYKRKYSIHEWQTPQVTAPAYDPLRVSVSEVVLPKVATSEKIVSRKSFEKNGAWTYISQSDKNWSDRTVLLRFEMRKLSTLEHISAGALIYSLREKLAPELELLQSRGVSLSLGYEGGRITIKAVGQKGDEFAAIEWLLNELHSYKPQAIEVKNYADQLALNVLKSDEGFPGQVAMQLAKDLVSPKDVSLFEAQSVAAQLNVNTVEKIRTVIGHANKTVSVAGEYSEAEIKQLKKIAEVISPVELNPQSETRFQVKQAAELIEPWQDDYISGVGVARILAGPGSANLIDQAAIRIVSTLLHEKVFVRNRPYGYVQASTRLVYSKDDQQIAFFGQADREDQIAKLEAVWDEEINRWLADEVKAEEVEKGRTGIRAQLIRQLESSNEAAHEALSMLDTSGNPFRKDEVLKAVEAVTHDQIRAAAKKYLGKNQPRLRLVKGIGTFTNCEDMVQARRAWRQANTPD